MKRERKEFRIPPFVWLVLVLLLLALDVGLVLSGALSRSPVSAASRKDEAAPQELLYERVLSIYVDGTPLTQPGLSAQEGRFHYAPAGEFLAALDPVFWAEKRTSFSYTPYLHNGEGYLCVEEFCLTTGLSACQDAEGQHLWCTTAAGNWSIPAGVAVPVLWYEGVGENSDRFVPVSTLDWQLYTLLVNGYTPIRLEDLSRADQLEKPVLLCFDGSDAGVAGQLSPLLKKYGVPVTLFVDASTLGGYQGLTSEQLSELADTGLYSIQCKLPEGQAALPYKAALLYASNREPFAVICGGELEEDTLNALRSQFHFRLSIDGESYVTGSDPMQIPCLSISPEMTMEEFAQRFA